MSLPVSRRLSSPSDATGKERNVTEEGEKAVKGCTWIDRIKGEINEIREGKETRRMRQCDEGFFIYKPDWVMTDNLHLGDQSCHSNRRGGREG